MSDQDSVRRLADAKAYLERRLNDLEKEISSLKSLVEIVDRILAEKSFKRVETPLSVKAQLAVTFQPTLKTPLMTAKGVQLADLIVEGKNITVLPASDMKFEVNTPPVKGFLITKVLDPIRNKDREQVLSGRLPENEAFSYELIDDGGVIKEIRVKNFGDDKRLLELNSSIKWTLRRLYERTIGE